MENKEDKKKILESVRIGNLALPILLGLGVVGYMMYRSLDLEALNQINWQFNTVFWLGVCIVLYIIRHVVLSYRLKLVSEDAFSLRKCMELIVIWEFSSAVSPTSVGGSGVALVLLAQEKLSGAKTVAIVLYTVVLDTLFLVLSMVLFYIVLGPIFIRPGMQSITDIDGYGYTFLTVLAIMIGYGMLFAYGLFINPNTSKRFLILISRIPFLKRYKKNLQKTATDLVLTSQEMKKQPYYFHLNAFLSTGLAWMIRFFAINCIILAVVPDSPLNIFDQSIILGRGEAMHTITSMSPTPGGAGIAEYLFGGFYSDYVPLGIAVLIALIWRVITYYSYLFLGVIVIPPWIKGIRR